jgi:opacity protein-like surface antigen
MSLKTKIIGTLAVSLVSLTVASHAQDAMMSDREFEPGFYVGAVQVQRTVEASLVDLDGDGTGFMVGYRVNPILSIEFEQQDIEYDNATIGNFLVHDAEGEFTSLALVYRGDYGNWQPYFKLIFGDSEVSLSVTGDGETASSSGSDSGEAFAFGFDYAVTGNFALRADYTIQSEYQDVISIGPIWHF